MCPVCGAALALVVVVAACRRYDLHEADCFLDVALRSYHNRFGRPFRLRGKEYRDQHHSINWDGKRRELGWTPLWQKMDAMPREQLEALGFEEFLSRPPQPEAGSVQFEQQYSSSGDIVWS